MCAKSAYRASFACGAVASPSAAAAAADRSRPVAAPNAAHTHPADVAVERSCRRRGPVVTHTRRRGPTFVRSEKRFL